VCGILFLVVCALPGCDLFGTSAPDTETPLEPTRELATVEQPIDGGEGEKELPPDWESLYQYLKYQIDTHSHEYPKGNLKWYHPYVEALEVFASDRDRAFQYAQQAQAEGNDYYFNKFMDLVERAQAEGDAVLGQADLLFRLADEFGERGWHTLCLQAEGMGKPIYDKAIELGFDKTITQGQMRTLLREALDQLENPFGHLPPYLWPYPDRQPYPQADEGLKEADWPRQLARYFELDQEYNYATDLLSRYLKDALCLLPRGHKWYLALANQYGLEAARDHIEGFYATIYGQVEIEKAGQREPAPGATVRVFAPKDNQTWTTTADKNGEYRIGGVILHDDCSPFQISADHEGDSVDDAFEGPLDDPDPGYEYEKDLLIKKAVTWRVQAEETGQSSLSRDDGELVCQCQHGLYMEFRNKPQEPGTIIVIPGELGHAVAPIIPQWTFVLEPQESGMKVLSWNCSCGTACTADDIDNVPPLPQLCEGCWTYPIVGWLVGENVYLTGAGISSGLESYFKENPDRTEGGCAPGDVQGPDFYVIPLATFKKGDSFAVTIESKGDVGWQTATKLQLTFIPERK